MDSIDRAIIDTLQGDFPVVDEPFQAVAARLGISESELLRRVRSLLERGVIARFGPLYQIERLGGAYSLAAMRVPPADFERVAAIVNARPEVSYNYEREHAFNMWFVLAAESPAEIAGAIAQIERASGYPVYEFPKRREFLIELRLPVAEAA